MCQYTWFDVGGVEIHEYKRSKQCQRCQRYPTDFNALNVMYVEDGVCSFYTTLHTELLNLLLMLKVLKMSNMYSVYTLLTFLDLSTTRVIAGKTHSQSPILKLTKGALSNLVILTYLQTKLHPPCPNQTAYLVYEFRSKKYLQCLKTMGLYNSFGVSRFNSWQSWLTRASRFSNSQTSALNAEVSTHTHTRLSLIACTD